MISSWLLCAGFWLPSATAVPATANASNEEQLRAAAQAGTQHITITADFSTSGGLVVSKIQSLRVRCHVLACALMLFTRRPKPILWPIVLELLFKLVCHDMSLWKGLSRGPQSEKATLCDMTECGPHGREARVGAQPAA